MTFKHWTQSGNKVKYYGIEHAIVKEHAIYHKLLHKVCYIFEIVTFKTCVKENWFIKQLESHELHDENIQKVF